MAQDTNVFFSPKLETDTLKLKNELVNDYGDIDAWENRAFRNIPRNELPINCLFAYEDIKKLVDKPDYSKIIFSLVDIEEDGNDNRPSLCAFSFKVESSARKINQSEVFVSSLRNVTSFTWGNSSELPAKIILYSEQDDKVEKPIAVNYYFDAELQPESYEAFSGNFDIVQLYSNYPEKLMVSGSLEDNKLQIMFERSLIEKHFFSDGVDWDHIALIPIIVGKQAEQGEGRNIYISFMLVPCKNGQFYSFVSADQQEQYLPASGNTWPKPWVPNDDVDEYSLKLAIKNYFITS